MAITYNFKKGTDIPSWLWLRQFPGGVTQPGTSNTYDGTRYMYWVIQSGTAATTASTTQLWRFDTWSNGWQFMITITSGNQGLDIEYDSQRNVLYIIHGAALTSWQVFNLNTFSVTIANVACAAWALTTMTPVLTTAANLGSSISQPKWQDVPGAISVTVGTAPFTYTPTTGNLGAATVGTGSTATNLVVDAPFFTYGMIGLEITFGAATTTAALQNKSYIISAVAAGGLSATVAAMAASPVSTDTFIVSLPSSTATAGAVGTLTDTTVTWPVNQYSNSDVVIVSGTGAGQRRRIASNTATVLTLAAAVTGNANTGNFSVAPDATSVYQIQPSSDFLYYFVANGTTTAYKLDVSQTTGVAWVAIGVTPGALSGGSNSFYTQATSPFSLLIHRGGAATIIYWYSVGLNTYFSPTLYAGGETFTTGAHACLLHGKRKMLLTKEGAQRNYVLDLMTGILEPFPMSMYAVPSAYDGKRARFVKTADGVEWVYLMRAAGSEFWRIPVEWL